jgi:hypothetical protein
MRRTRIAQESRVNEVKPEGEMEMCPEMCLEMCPEMCPEM